MVEIDNISISTLIKIRKEIKKAQRKEEVDMLANQAIKIYEKLKRWEIEQGTTGYKIISGLRELVRTLRAANRKLKELGSQAKWDWTLVDQMVR